MSRFNSFPKSISINIPKDETGMTGRECPLKECLGYFKVQFGTGLKGDGLPCHCPYCGHTAPHDHFWTQEQLAYAKSVAFREVSSLITKELKKLEFNYKPRGSFGIGISMKVKHGPRPPLRSYREKQLETDVTCEECTLRYAVYGVFAYCPDCHTHNSLQILVKNLELAIKELELADQLSDQAMKEHLEADALENVVAAFDGFGREICRVHARQATVTEQAETMSFQNLIGAERRLKAIFGVELATMLTPDDWTLAIQCFQKRHLLAHNVGVVDQRYLDATGDPGAILGRKVRISPDEVRDLVKAIRSLGSGLVTALRELAPTSSML